MFHSQICCVTPCEIEIIQCYFLRIPCVVNPQDCVIHSFLQFYVYLSGRGRGFGRENRSDFNGMFMVPTSLMYIQIACCTELILLFIFFHRRQQWIL